MSPEVAAARAAAAAAAAATAPPAPATPAAKPRPAAQIYWPRYQRRLPDGVRPGYGHRALARFRRIGHRRRHRRHRRRHRVPGHSGTLYAYSADKGEKLLELKTGIPGGMAPPITFMVDGKQYVALQVGQGRAGSGAGWGNTPPPNPNAPPPVNPRLLVYALDGTAKLP